MAAPVAFRGSASEGGSSIACRLADAQPNARAAHHRTSSDGPSKARLLLNDFHQAPLNVLDGTCRSMETGVAMNENGLRQTLVNVPDRGELVGCKRWCLVIQRGDMRYVESRATVIRKETLLELAVVRQLILR